MYYFAKVIQAAGLTIVFIDFIVKFPQLMNRTILVIGIALFTSGWVLQRYLVKGNNS